MKQNFAYTKGGRETIQLLLQEHEDFIISNLDQVGIDLDVVHQHSRISKWWCWLWFNHLYKSGICARCGKEQKYYKAPQETLELISNTP